MGLDQMFVPYYLPFTRKMLDMCRYCVAFTVSMDVEEGKFSRLLQPYHPHCSLGWTLDTDDLRIACSIHPP